MRADDVNGETTPGKIQLNNRAATKLTLRKKLLFACATTVGFFVLLEGTLALLGVGVATETRDPLVGFSAVHPVFVEEVGGGQQTLMRTANGKRVWFNDQSFAKNKPANTYRVFCLGGSTTYGRPYAHQTSISGWMQELLPRVDRDVNWEVINAGGVSYASYRVATVMEELAQYEPDLFVVYSGHNEFLERRTYAEMFEASQTRMDLFASVLKTRTGSAIKKLIQSDQATEPAEVLPAEVDELLNHSVGPRDYHRDDDWQSRVLQHYELNLRRMVSIAKDCGARIVFLTTASNESNCEPFKSEMAKDLDDEQRDAFVANLQNGITLAAEDRHAEALEAFARARQIDSRHAGLLDRIGRSRFELGQFEQSKEAFASAIEEDICPLRAVEAINQSIRKVATETATPLVDFENRLRRQSQKEFGHEIFGDEYFLDHVHPTVEVHGWMARWTIETMMDESLITGTPIDTDAYLAASDRILGTIDFETQGVALRNLAKVIHWSGKYQEAEKIALSALEVLEDDPDALWVLADCQRLTADPKLAMQTYERLLNTAPTYERAYLGYSQLLIDSGRFQEAMPFLNFSGLGASPTSGTTAWVLQSKALAATGMGKVDEAIEYYQQLLKIDSDDWQSRYRLSLLLIKQRRFEEAAEQLTAALEISPNNADVLTQLNIAKQLAGSE